MYSIEELKRKYPKGTRFHPAHLKENTTLDLYYCVSTGVFEINAAGDINVPVKANFNYATFASPCIYYNRNNNWAKNINQPISMNKQITLTLDQARRMYGKSPEMDELLLANFTDEELTKHLYPVSWEGLKRVAGFFLNRASVLCPANNVLCIYDNKNVFATSRQAESSLAMAQLSQLMKAYNGDWEKNWDDLNYCYVILRRRDAIATAENCSEYQFLSFKSEKLRDLFLENFKNLIKQYFMID